MVPAGWANPGAAHGTGKAGAAAPAHANGASGGPSAQDSGGGGGSQPVLAQAPDPPSSRGAAASGVGYTCVAAAQRGGVYDALVAGTSDGWLRWLDLASGAVRADVYCRPLHRWQARCSPCLV